ncbi:MAG TPA: reverse transcriptase domain-containing protein [Mycobacteriales bacterium]|nr:reverse transcriptase domain-containing protein [Mycobacteriales bacterium]
MGTASPPVAAPLYDAATALPALTAAWDELLADDRQDGVLGEATRRFEANAGDRLAELADQLRSESYRPAALTEVVLVADGGRRTLQVPAVRDRVLEKALAAVIAPFIDPVLGPSSFAYRPGLGVADAVQAVARLRDEGLGWVARTDVDDCFPSMQVGRIRRILGALLDDDAILDLIDALLARNVTRPGGWRRLAGLAQGSPLSPMLANLALAHLDDRVRQEGFPIVRYSDDLVICTASKPEAWEALRSVAAAWEEIGMSSGADKTEVMSFDDGLAFSRCGLRAEVSGGAGRAPGG